MVLNVAKNKTTNDYLRKEKDRLIDCLVDQKIPSRRSPTEPSDTSSSLFREFRNDLNKSISKFVQSTAPTSAGGKRPAAHESLATKDKNKLVSATSRARSIATITTTSRAHRQLTERVPLHRQYSVQPTTRWACSGHQWTGDNKENTKLGAKRTTSAVGAKSALDLRRSLSLVDGAEQQKKSSAAPRVTKTPSPSATWFHWRHQTGTSKPSAKNEQHQHRSKRTVGVQQQQQQPTPFAGLTNQVKRALDGGRRRAGSGCVGSPLSLPLNNSRGNKSSLMNLLSRPTQNRLHFLLFTILVSSSLMLAVSQSTVLGAPIPLYEDAEPSVPNKKAISWFRDGLMTIDPIDPMEEQQQQQLASEIPSNQNYPARFEAENDQPADGGDFSSSTAQADSGNVARGGSLLESADWFAFPSSEELAALRVQLQQQQQREPSPSQLEQQDAQESQPDRHGEEFLMIQRRRLNRDRALEPPAWLRERPIRRDQAQNIFDEAEDEQRQDELGGATVSSKPKKSLAMDASLVDADQVDSSRPIRGRQLRQSNELYDEILRHLVEEAFSGRNLLLDLRDELESRAQANNRQQLQQQQAGLDANQLAAADGQQVADSARGKLRQKQPSDADSSVVVVGDEISDNDDATLLEPAQKQQQQSNQNMAPGNNPNGNEKLLDNLQQLRAGQANGRLMSMAAAAADADQSGDLYQQQLQPMSSDDSPGSSGLIEMLRASLDSIPSDQFHVVEEIDQVADQQQQPANMGSSNNYEVGAAGQLTAALEDNPDESEPSSSSTTIEKRSTEPMFVVDGSTAAESSYGSNPDGDEEKELADSSLDDAEEEEAQLFLVPVRKSAAFSGRRVADSGATRAAAAAATKSNTGGQQSAVANSMQETSAMKQRQLVLAGLVRLIQMGRVPRQQLIRMATKLKVTLEQSLGLPRGSILGLFPAAPTQLIIELDEAQVGPRDRARLGQEFDYNRGLLTVSWPRGRPQNPLPILSAILNALRNDTLPNDQPDDAAAVEGPARKQQQQLPLAARRRVSMDNNEADYFTQLIQQQLETSRASNERQQQQQQLDPIDQKWQQVRLAALANQLGRQQSPARQSSWGWSYFDRLLAGGRGASPVPNVEENDDDNDEADDDDRLAVAAANIGDDLWWERQKLERLATLIGYLSGLQQTISQQQQQQQQQQAALINPLATLSAATLLEKSLIGTRKHHQQLPANRTDHYWHFAYLAVILVALLGTFLIVKMFARRLDKRFPLIRHRRLGRRDNRSSWRSFWSLASDGSSGGSSASASAQQLDGAAHGAASSTAGTLVGEKMAHQNELGAGNCRRRPSDLDSGLDTIGTIESADDQDKQKGHLQFDLLTQRLLNMLKFYYNSSSSRSRDDPSLEKSTTEEKPSKGAAVDAELVADVESNVEQATRFRTSRSYIKSLIDALTKARSRVFVDDPTTASAAESNRADDEDEEDEEEDDEFAGDFEKSSSPLKRRPPRNRRTDDETADEIVVSQMDISAAHLILDYMEKHLEDKERLRREWLELNGCEHNNNNSSNSNNNGNPNGKPTRANKAQQLVLQRLAKVGSNEQNRPKNRNQFVVPFDRNRVRLGQRQRSGGSGASPTSSIKLGAQQARSRRANKSQVPSGAKQHQQQQSDYINASFIYDDDPRRPTHIIAQGPNEQTIGQFWQMIWEQEVSLIVMLTRLNENGQRHCHCYWPTNNNNSSPAANQCAADQPAATSVGGTNAAPPPTTKKAVAPPPASPRQPTAPFELVGELSGAGSPPTGAARRGSVTSVFSSNALVPLSQPIVANGDVDDNVLYFDVPMASGLGSNRSSTDIDEDEMATAVNTPADEQQTHQPNAATATTTVRLEVHLISEHVSSSDYLVRNMYLINRSTGETRTITQFHYLSWPESKTPENVRSLLQFRRKVHKSYRSLASPILVHCSDGAGRSGTYTLLDIILERIKNGAKEIDPRATLEHLRDQRIGLCATQSQFEFVLVALAEEIQIILNALPK